MIIKSFEVNKVNLNENKLILLYGKNEELKKNFISLVTKNKSNIHNYDERDLLENENIFIEGLLSKSLFEENKIIIVKRVTDKIIKIIDNLNLNKLENINIIFLSEILEKKSKLRSFFEKDKVNLCVPFYPDNEQTLFKIAFDFLKEKKISISNENINLLVTKSNGDRKHLLNELEKIEYFSKNKKSIKTEDVIKISNLSENFSISEMVDNCLAKNLKKTINILNENNFSNEDCIFILRTFLNKFKRVLLLTKEYEKNKNIDLTISSAKPPIFWKDKEIVKKQIYNWKPKKIKELIYRLSKEELLIKKNFNNSINIITDFVLELTSSKTNN
tara:strand:- start:56 stop:1048 length:993 start_codon:yes stop_codon:yes gene_type:complete